jgi:hypothetical protein
MAEVAGDIARAAAAAPLTERKAEPVKAKGKFFGWLGAALFALGDGKQYPRSTGFGSNRKPHPDGGTNETIAWITFRPAPGLELELQGRVYCERFMDAGKAKRVFSISLPFLKAERKDSKSRDAIETLKADLRDQYRGWLKSADHTDAVASKPATTSAGVWSEDDSQ